jgi:hypothetical protein
MKNKMKMYSVFSGTFYEIPEDDFKLMDIGQLPLTKTPAKCNKCYGRGHLGKDTQTNGYAVCFCVRKVINHDIIRNAENLTIG